MKLPNILLLSTSVTKLVHPGLAKWHGLRLHAFGADSHPPWCSLFEQLTLSKFIPDEFVVALRKFHFRLPLTWATRAC